MRFLFPLLWAFELLKERSMCKTLAHTHYAGRNRSKHWNVNAKEGVMHVCVSIRKCGQHFSRSPTHKFICHILFYYLFTRQFKCEMCSNTWTIQTAMMIWWYPLNWMPSRCVKNNIPVKCRKPSTPNICQLTAYSFVRNMLMGMGTLNSFWPNSNGFTKQIRN